jgi:hypothetical protein
MKMHERQTQRDRTRVQPTRRHRATARQTISSQSSRTRTALLAFTLISFLTLSACSERRETNETAPTATPTPTATNANAQANQPAQPNTSTSTNTQPTPAPATPQPAEINDKVARIFHGAVQLDASQKTPALVGDFDGDGAEDIAFAVRPTAAGLEEINSEVSTWTLVDPRQVVLPDPHRAVQKLPPIVHVKAQQGDTFLAIIHGYGKDGWRDTAAQQTYLLRNAVGRNPQVASKQDASSRFNLRFRGDVIEEELAGTRGVLEWTGATYAWLAAPKH